MSLGAIDYESTEAPVGYKCTACGRHGCKLWREYQTFADRTELRCCDCAGSDQSFDVSSIDANGKINDPDLGLCDQIGWFVPAVPTAEGDTFWGYTSVPDAGVRWWRNLPTRVEKTHEQH